MPEADHSPLSDHRSSDEPSAVALLLAGDTSGRNGDDAAVLRVPGGLCCVTTDTAIEGVHLLPAMSPREMGYRAAACALSDLAGMAATALAVVCAVSVPEGRWGDVPAIAAGVRERCAELGCDLVGGDLTAAAASGDAAPLSITITCVGTGPGVGRNGLLSRAGARAGDALYVTGQLGSSQAGLEQLRTGIDTGLATSYLRPPLRQLAARALAAHASSMIDVSDGIASDVRRLADGSGCGFTVELSDLPIDPAVAAQLSLHGDPAVIAATAGDDYELLLTASPDDEQALRAALQRADTELELTKIGAVADIGITYTQHGARVDGLCGYSHP